MLWGRGRFPEGEAIVPTGARRPACWAGAMQAQLTQLGALPRLPNSIIRGVNQDRFIQRAIEAANAYSSILRAVQAAEGAAGQALQQASHAWAVRPWRSPQPPQEPLPTPAPIGWVRTLSCPHVCRRWYSRAWGREPGSCGPTAVAWGKRPSGSSGGWTTVSAASARMSGLCGDPQALGSVREFVGGYGTSVRWPPCVGTLLPTGSACLSKGHCPLTVMESGKRTRGQLTSASAVLAGGLLGEEGPVGRGGPPLLERGQQLGFSELWRFHPWNGDNHALLWNREGTSRHEVLLCFPRGEGPCAGCLCLPVCVSAPVPPGQEDHSGLAHGAGTPELRLLPLQCGPLFRTWTPSSATPRPRRSSWQARSRRCRPCWPWTQVGRVSSLSSLSQPVPRGERAPATRGRHSSQPCPLEICDKRHLPSVLSRTVTRAAEGSPIAGGPGPRDLPLGTCLWLGDTHQTSPEQHVMGGKALWRR